MRKLLLAIALSLLPAAAGAQTPSCPLGSIATGKLCSISDYTVGGAVTDNNAIVLCQQPNGCFSTSPYITYTQVPMSALKSYLGGGNAIVVPNSQLLGGNGSALVPVAVGTGLNLTAGTLNATGTTFTIPNAPLVSGNGTILGSVALGTGLTLTGTFPSQTLNTSAVGTVTSVAPGTNLTAAPSPIVGAGTISCPNVSSTAGGCVPASGGGTANFLRADATWATPPGGGATPMREVTTGTSETATTSDCNGTIVWNSTTTGAKTETLPTCATGQSITVVDGKGDAVSGGEINIQSPTGQTLAGSPALTPQLLVGAARGSVKLVYDATSTNWVVGASSNPGSVLAASTTTISNGQWFSDTTFTVGASGLTLTLPTSANAVANGGITIQSMGYPITLAAQGSDTVQYGSGAGTASLLVPANAIAVVTRSGTTFQVAWKFAELQTMSWSAGMNLAACASPPCSIPMFHVGQQTTLGLAQAMVSVPAGGTATLDIITAPDGTALGAGTVISTAPANANGAAGTLQTLSLSSGTLAAGTTVGVRATGWATGAQAGVGMVQIALQ